MRIGLRLAIGACLAAAVYLCVELASQTVAYAVWQSPEDNAPILKLRPLLSWQPSPLNNVASRNLLGLRREEKAPQAILLSSAFVDADAGPRQMLSCSLPGVLRATLESSEPSLSRAMVVDSATHETRMVSAVPGQNRLDAETEVVEIRRLAVVLRRLGHWELCLADGQTVESVLHVEPPAPAVEQFTETHYQVDRHDLAAWFGDLPTLAQDAEITPHWEGNHIDGIKLGDARGFLERLGLRDGDVVQRINGYDMDDASQVKNIYEKLQRALLLVVKLQRGGHELVMNYKVK